MFQCLSGAGVNSLKLVKWAIVLDLQKTVHESFEILTKLVDVVIHFEHQENKSRFQTMRLAANSVFMTDTQKDSDQ